MIFIKLTSIYNHEFYLNMADISNFSEDDSGAGSILYRSNSDEEFHVKEKPNFIFELLNESRS